VEWWWFEVQEHSGSPVLVQPSRVNIVTLKWYSGILELSPAEAQIYIVLSCHGPRVQKPTDRRATGIVTGTAGTPPQVPSPAPPH
jgi:hypothetical protein